MSKNSINILLQNIEIPDIVKEKAQNAFSQISMEGKEEHMEVIKYNKKRHPLKKTRAAAIVLAAIVGGGSITAVAAAYIHWSQGMQSKMNVSEEQMIALQNKEDTPLSFPEVADTQGEITVSVAQCLLDDNDIRVAFYVEGYELSNAESPQLENLNILLDGEPVNNYEWSFYTGVDGEEEGTIPNDQAEEERLELDLILSPVDENGKSITDLAGKVITVQMVNFGDTTGTWTLEWILEGTSTVVEKQLHEVLGNSGATVTKVSLSPISIKVCYDFAPAEISDIVLDENGNAVEVSDYAEPPQFVGVKMTDGTVYTAITDGGTYGYEDVEASLYVAEISLSRVLDPEKVQSLLFLKDELPATEQEITEDQCYIIELK